VGEHDIIVLLSQLENNCLLLIHAVLWGEI
jgi:hypothetical protein